MQLIFTSLADLIMKFLITFLIICLFPQTILGAPRAVCPTQTIEVVEGENVALHSGLDPPVNLSRYTVDWRRVDNQQFVYVYRDGRDYFDPVVDQYRGRTAIDHEDLSRGILTLKISSANLSDSGSYKCFVPRLKVWCEVHLIVEEKETKTDVSSTTGPAVEEVTETDDSNTTGPADRGGNWEAVRAAVISTVVFLLCGLVVFLVLRSRAMRRSTQHNPINWTDWRRIKTSAKAECTIMQR